MIDEVTEQRITKFAESLRESEPLLCAVIYGYLGSVHCGLKEDFSRHVMLYVEESYKKMNEVKNV